MSFYPEGWTHEDLFNKPLDDILALPDDQRTTLFDGLKATFGEDGFNEIKQEINRRHWARREAAEESKQESVQELLATFIRNLNSVFQTETTEDWGNWGFVVFRTTPYGGEHETQWAEFRRRWDALIEEGLAPYRGTLPKVDKAISLLQFQWVEQPELEGASAAEVARYVSLGFRSRPFCHYADGLYEDVSVKWTYKWGSIILLVWWSRQLPWILSCPLHSLYPRHAVSAEQFRLLLR